MLEQKLNELEQSDIYPFHMPGHKRAFLPFANPYAIDITEIEGFDNLHHATGILQEAQQKAADLYGAKKTYYLINGSTCGLLAAISAAVPRGEKILMARNCHKAVYHAMYLRQLVPVYLYPEDTAYGIQGQVTPQMVRKQLEQTPDIRAVVITSPTYDGVVSDIKNIADTVHAYGIPLIVDEAHGAHFGFSPEFPENATRLGADAVIMSVHKTLPAFTQTALLHLCSDRIAEKKVAQFLGIYETSSPSYLLMAGIEKSLQIIEKDREMLFAAYSRRLAEFRDKTKNLKTLQVLQPSDFSKQEAFSFDPGNFQEIAYRVADAFFGEDVPADTLKQIVYDTLSFDVPLVKVTENIYSLELFHGPTLAFKDVGGRFMARLLGYFIRKEGKKQVNVLVATSGDTGSAVANGFLGVEGIHVYVLYPKGKVSEIQEKQFTTLGQNITALEVDGTFDDCQALVKAAFMDKELNEHMQLTSANSINVARFLPQAFYYFYAYAQLKRAGKAGDAVICVPSGNFGNITAGLFGKRMGLPVKRFIASNNRNDIFYQYLQTGVYAPRPSIATIANAMDVGDPSNFARVLDLYGGSHAAISAEISGATYTDGQIAETMKEVWKGNHYLLDPHGACGFRALQEGLQAGETGIFLETAHPAKFKDTVEKIIGEAVQIPEKLQAFMRGEKKSLPMSKGFEDFKRYLMSI